MIVDVGYIWPPDGDMDGMVRSGGKTDTTNVPLIGDVIVIGDILCRVTGRIWDKSGDKIHLMIQYVDELPEEGLPS